MNEYVLDCSFTMAWCFEDELDDSVLGFMEDMLAGDVMYVPDYWRVEVRNALAVGIARERITLKASLAFLAKLELLPIIYEPIPANHYLNTLFQRAHESGLSLYDWLYLDIAERYDFTLLTLDKKQAQVAKALGVSVFAKE